MRLNEEVFKINIKDYTYELPPEKIAQSPLENRDASKLLIYSEETISENIFSDIPSFIPPGSLLIFNDTKVVRARILFPLNELSFIEIFCLEPADTADYLIAFNRKSECRWSCLVGNLRKWKREFIEKEITVGSQMYLLKAERISKTNDSFEIRFTWEPGDITFGELLDVAGLIPLPPYIKREAIPNDSQRYQTVYSKYEGSVAAPTAGLHFTETVLGELESRGVKKEFVTLHVGAGTFKPVKSEVIEDHKMHREMFSVSRQAVEALLEQKEKVICVGTTSLRTIETLYWLGLKLKNNPETKELDLSQWEAYEMEPHLSVFESLQSLLQFMDNENISSLTGYTELIIVPGYEFKIAKGLITNFHQPNSTLLLLVAAFTNGNWNKIYEYALNNDFRFLSYGDSSLLLR